MDRGPSGFSFPTLQPANLRRFRARTRPRSRERARRARNPGVRQPSLSSSGAGAVPAVPGGAGGATGAAGAGSEEAGRRVPRPPTPPPRRWSSGWAQRSAAAEPSGRPWGPRRSLRASPYHAPGPGRGRPSSQDTMPEGDGGEVPALIPDGEPLREEVARCRAGAGEEIGAAGDRGWGDGAESPRAPATHDVIREPASRATVPGQRGAGLGGRAGTGGRLPLPVPPRSPLPVL